MLIISVQNTLDDLVDLLGQLDQDQYSEQHRLLSDSTIGQHVRHVIEMFQCLLSQYDGGIINYDLRKRNTLTETLPDYAAQCVLTIKEQVLRPEKQLKLEQRVGDSTLRLDTNYFRELLYNLEHCVHHQALIRVATMSLKNVKIHEDFGVAQSTTNYKKQCAP